MFDKILYVNNFGDEIVFGDGITFANHNDLRDYVWDYEMQFGKISNFKRSSTTKTIPIVIKTDTPHNLIKLKNRLFNVFERDVLSDKKGRLYIGDYYFECFIVEGRYVDYLDNRTVMNKEISIVTDTPQWILEDNFSFSKDNDIKEVSYYPYDYNRQYSSGHNVGSMVSDSYSKSDFRIEVEGPALNPEITIGGNVYSVNVGLSDNERLIIDSRDKIVSKIRSSGNESNEFNNRLKSLNIFKRVESGYNLVSWNGDFNFKLKLFLERSEPEWT